VRVTVAARQRAVFTDILRRMDALELATMPTAELSAPAVDLGDVVLGAPKAGSLALRNTGPVMAAWRFVPKLEDRGFCAPWLVVDPPFGMLAPGASATLTFTVLYSVAVARDVSLGRLTTLDDILVLRVERGRDFFVSVTARPLPTAFGCSLEQLARRPEPIRSLPLPVLAGAAVSAIDGRARAPSTVATPSSAASTPAGAGGRTWGEGGGAAGAGVSLAVPKEVWRLVDALLARGGLEYRGVFLASGDPAEMAAVRDALDTGAELPPATPLSLAQTLLHLLASLRDPLIPPPLFPGPDFVPTHAPAYVKTLFSRLSAVRFNTLVYLLALARECLAPAHFPHNGLRAPQLAAVLSRALMRRVPHDAAAVHANVPGAAALRGTEAGAGAAAADGLAASYVWAPDAADPGTNWTPTETEQAMMTHIFLFLLTAPRLEA
jgi:phosphatidylinositol-bisphosphatase